MKHSTKPDKPKPDFPLFAHDNGRRAKKIRGRLHYLGKWDDPDGALITCLDRKDDLQAGRKPRQVAGEPLVKDVLNHFMTAKKCLLDSGEITAPTWSDYFATRGLRTVAAPGAEPENGMGGLPAPEDGCSSSLPAMA